MSTAADTNARATSEPDRSPPRRLVILFSLLHPGYLRTFDSTIRSLAERGHRVQLLFDNHRKAEDVGRILLREYAAKYGIGYHVRSFPPTFWSEWARWIRSVRDYTRYFRPEFRHATKLRHRAGANVPSQLRRLVSLRGVRRLVSGRAFAWVLTRAEAAVPANKPLMRYFRHYGIDLLVVSPFVDFESPQTDHMKAAHALGIRTVLPVASWDNLTNKGQIRLCPDLVGVWNHLQEQEAISIHGIPRERIVVTGAEPFDHWFGWQPRSRDEFCARIGLDPSRPYVFYAGSSGFISGDETAFVAEWLDRLRTAADPVLRSAGVVIRPHPQNVHFWQQFDTSRFGDVLIYPRRGMNPLNVEDKQDYFDSIYHSACSVGINTSAQIESAILQREVFTILDDRFRETQEGTLHFHYLVNPEFGFLRVARSFDEHFDQLARALQPDDQVRVRAKRFLETFIRPHGIDVAATPRLVAAIERVGEQAPSRARNASWLAAGMSLLPASLASAVAAVAPRLTGARSSSMPKSVRRKIKERRRQRKPAGEVATRNLTVAK